MDAARTHEAWDETWSQRWAPAGFPDGQGGMWTWAEPEAATKRIQGGLRLEVPRFQRSHGHVQIFDNPKHLLAGPAIPVGDRITVTATLSGALLGGDTSDWSNGFASLNLMDFENGLVVDGLHNGARTGLLFERLHIPGMIPPENAFTTIAEGPATQADKAHTYRFRIDNVARRIEGFIDGRLHLDVRNVPARIRSLTPGFGLITLRPIADGMSTSLRGQGARGWLGPLSVG